MKLTTETIKEKFKVITTDEKKFSIEDALFDDRNFNIVYLICGYGGLLSHQRVLVSPLVIQEVDILEKTIHVDMDAENLTDGPSPDYKVPVSREYDDVYLNYPMHPYFLGAATDSIAAEEEMKIYRQEKALRGRKNDKPNHTRAINEVENYSFKTRDDKKGEISDWILDTTSWELCHFNATVGNFWNKKTYLVPTTSIEKISFIEREVKLSIDKNAIFIHRDFDPEDQVNKNWEVTDYDYYGRSQKSQSM